MSEDQNQENHPGFTPQKMPEPSTAVSAVCEAFRMVTHEHIAITPCTDLAALVHDFGKGFANQNLYDVSMLADVGNRLGDSITRNNAMRALGVYREHVPQDYYERVTNLLSDFPVIDDFIDHQLTDHRKAVSHREPGLHDAFDKNNHAPIDQRLWRVDAGLPHLKRLLELAKDVNLETIFIKACEALQLLNDENTADNVLYRTIYAVESTYAPLCETIGLDAFAATLLSKTYQIRLEKSGQESVVQDARNAINAMGTREEIAGFLANLPSLFIGESLHEPVVNNSSGHETFFNMALSRIETEHFSGDVRVLLRVKSVGSTARKISRSGRIPADLIGVTIITDNVSDVGTVYAHILEKLSTMQNVEFVPAPSRDTSLHAKGSAEFVDTIKAAVQSLSKPLELEDKVNNGGFEYAKFTVDWQRQDGRTMPLEVQFMHYDSRTKSRIGLDSHTLFKYFKLSDQTHGDLSLHEAVESQRQLHQRKDHLYQKSMATNGISQIRGQELRHLIDLKQPSSYRRRGEIVVRASGH